MQSFLKNFTTHFQNTFRYASQYPLKLLYMPKCSKEIIEKLDVTPQSPKPFDLTILLRKTKDLWATGRIAGLSTLSLREIGELPWILYFGDAPQIAEDQELTTAILHLLGRRRSRNLIKLIRVYLSHFNPDMPGTENIRKYIVSTLATYDKDIPWITPWKERAAMLFSSQGPMNVAKWLISNDQAAHVALAKLGITGDLATGAFIKAVIKAALPLAEKAFPLGLQNLLSLFEPGDHFRDLLPEAATRLIPKAGSYASPDIEDTLRAFFLRHMGDPRLPASRPWWDKVSPEAKQIFIQWVSKRDLEFFFEVVDSSSKDPRWIYRRKFWEAYLPYIENTWVALGPRARSLIGAPKMVEHLQERKFGELAGGESTQSIFLIQMRGYVFVEWSHSGRCRVWRRESFGLEFGRPFYLASEIRHRAPDYSQIHRGSEYYSWQDELGRWIMIKTGIRPIKSYRLE